MRITLEQVSNKRFARKFPGLKKIASFYAAMAGFLLTSWVFFRIIEYYKARSQDHVGIITVLLK